MSMELTSSAFRHGDMIPAQYTCDGKDISPELKWSGVPERTQSFALIMDDPDAPVTTWDHWILFNIPPHISHLPEDVSLLPKGTRVGKNSWSQTTYTGPCPPDRAQHYIFTLFALDTVLNVESGIRREELQVAMHHHVLAIAELVGKYKRVD